MRTRKSGRLILALAAVLAAIPVSASAETAGIDSSFVLSHRPGTCFDGLVAAPDCSPVIPFAEDSLLAGAAQDAQIMSTRTASTNTSCGGYYLSNTIVSRYKLTKFITTFNPASDGVTLAASSVAVPAGFQAFDITAGPYDAYTYIAHLYQSNDPQVAGIAAPIYVLTASPVPRVGPGTQPMPADAVDAWAPKEVVSGTGTVVVFDTSLDPAKMDLAPADKFLDATAGHGGFVRGIADAAYTGPVRVVDITDSRGLITEAAMARALASYPFGKGDVASLSAGTYACRAGDHTIYPLLLADAVERLDGKDIPLVAAAGNDATDDPFYPAAWGVYPTPRYLRPCPAGTVYKETHTNLCMIDRAGTVTSVGSVSTSSTMVSYVTPQQADRSTFSNYGDWVEAWAEGEGVVSTYPGGAYWYCVPTDDVGFCEAPGRSQVPFDGAPAANIGTFARWSGTSFSTPKVAAWVAAGKG